MSVRSDTALKFESRPSWRAVNIGSAHGCADESSVLPNRAERASATLAPIATVAGSWRFAVEAPVAGVLALGSTPWIMPWQIVVVGTVVIVPSTRQRSTSVSAAVKSSTESVCLASSWASGSLVASLYQPTTRYASFCVVSTPSSGS
jgi:hypothetical protein